MKLKILCWKSKVFVCKMQKLFYPRVLSRYKHHQQYSNLVRYRIYTVLKLNRRVFRLGTGIYHQSILSLLCSSYSQTFYIQGDIYNKWACDSDEPHNYNVIRDNTIPHNPIYAPYNLYLGFLGHFFGKLEIEIWSLSFNDNSFITKNESKLTKTRYNVKREAQFLEANLKY